jgi:hypothetical protein
MSLRIHPSWDVLNRLRNPLTSGERTLLEFLDAGLPPAWQIFAQPYLNGSRPDVVIFNPFVGAMIFEVKDWSLAAYGWRDTRDGKRILCVDTPSGWRPIKSPIDQAGHYREKIIGQLVPAIGERVDDERRAFGLIKVGLYFHTETTACHRAVHPVNPHGRTATTCPTEPGIPSPAWCRRERQDADSRLSGGEAGFGRKARPHSDVQYHALALYPRHGRPIPVRLFVETDYV